MTEQAAKPSDKTDGQDNEANGLRTKAEFRELLLNVRDKMAEQSAPPIYALTVLNNALSLPHIYDLLDKTNKELARDIWLRLKQAGFQIKNPPLLFEADEEAGTAGA